MYTGLLHLHSLLRWVILLLLLVAIFRAVNGVSGRKPFTSGDAKTGLFLMISCDLMLLLGLYQWFMGAMGLKAISNSSFGVVMKAPVLRFFAVEHLIGMLLAIILVHIGRAAAKKNISDLAKHKKALLFYGLALIIILLMIPWPFRDAGAGRGWFPGM
jgi:hypothetical protein